MNEIRNTAFFGALGGFSGVILNLWLGNEARNSLLIDLLVATLLGASASILFVYLLANTDRRDVPRLVALSLLGGFAWQPVWEAGLALVQKTRSEQISSQVKNKIEDLQEKVSKVKQAESKDKPKLLEEIMENIETTNLLVEQIDSVSARKKLTKPTKQLIEQINKLPEPTKNQELKTERIQENLGSLETQIMLKPSYSIKQENK
jgi:hypothetical protein